MRTNVDIDDDLLTEAMAVSGLSPKKATVEEVLRRLVQRSPPAGRKIAGIAPGEPPADSRLAERFGILDQLLSSIWVDRSG